LPGRHEGSNLQDVDGRSRIGSGEATMTNADSHDSRQFPIFQFKNGSVSLSVNRSKVIE
jgi:hypothetical protein